MDANEPLLSGVQQQREFKSIGSLCGIIFKRNCNSMVKLCFFILFQLFSMHFNMMGLSCNWVMGFFLGNRIWCNYFCSIIFKLKFAGGCAVPYWRLIGFYGLIWVIFDLQEKNSIGNGE
jgi:hypothetical protein